MTMIDLLLLSTQAESPCLPASFLEFATSGAVSTGIMNHENMWGCFILSKSLSNYVVVNPVAPRFAEVAVIILSWTIW